MSFEQLSKMLDRVEQKISVELPEMADRILGLEQRNSGSPPAVSINGAPRSNRASGELVLRSAADMRAHFGSSTAAPSLVDFCRGVAGMKTSELATKALSVGTDNLGGFAVPRGTAGQILEALVPASTLMQAGVGIQPIGDMRSLTTAAVNAIPNAQWRAEAGAIADSDPTFRSVVSTPQSLSFRFRVSRELLADSPGMEQALEVVIAQAMARALDRAGLRGSGTAPEPRGLRFTTGVTLRASGPNGFAGPGWDTIMGAYQDLLALDSPPPTSVIMSPRSWARLFGATDTTGQPLQAPEPLRGLQFLTTSQIPNSLVVGTSNDTTEVYIGDFRMASWMMREELTIQRLDDQHALTGEIGLVGHVRADFSAFYPQAFAVVTGLR